MGLARSPIMPEVILPLAERPGDRTRQMSFYLAPDEPDDGWIEISLRVEIRASDRPIELRELAVFLLEIRVQSSLSGVGGGLASIGPLDQWIH